MLVTSGKGATVKEEVKVPTPIKKKRHIEPSMGYMVIFDEDDELRIGKVCLVGNETLHATLYTGSLKGQWFPFEDNKGNNWTKVVNKSRIKSDLIFYLTTSHRLPGFVKNALKDKL